MLFDTKLPIKTENERAENVENRNIPIGYSLLFFVN
jgi:hypothetical protein